VEALKKKINHFLRRWLAVPRIFCSIRLYSTGSKLWLPITSVVEEYKATKARRAMMLWDSLDERKKVVECIADVLRAPDQFCYLV
jgi:hypothetical protein